MKIVIIFFLLTILTQICRAQNYDPLTLSRKIFSPDTLKDIKKYSIDEFKGHPNWHDFKKSLKFSFELLDQNSETAVVALTISDSTGTSFDVYLHFKKDSIWKIGAVRTLALTGIIEIVHKQVAALSPLQVDSVINSKHVKGMDLRLFKTREEYRFLLGNTNMTLSSDKKLIEHFKKNKEKFNRIKDELIQKGIFNFPQGVKKMKKNSNLVSGLRDLYIDDVYPNFEETKGSLDFLIGGITDNALGYLYIREKQNRPKMSPGHFIMLRSLGNGWYLYKTT